MLIRDFERPRGGAPWECRDMFDASPSFFGQRKLLPLDEPVMSNASQS